MTRRLALSASLAVIAALGLTACGTTPASSSADDTTAYSTTATVAPADEATTSSSDRRELTRTAIDITWDAATPTDQLNMCNGIELFGTAWSAEHLREGAGGDDTLDWDYAAQIIQGKCGL